MAFICLQHAAFTESALRPRVQIYNFSATYNPRLVKATALIV